MRPTHLNLGSYKYPLVRLTNVDIYRWPGVDIVADLNVLPWPFDSHSIRHIRAVDIVEHLGKLTKTQIVAEMARIVEPGGTVEIRVPCSSHPWALASLQHAHSFQYNSFDNDYTQPFFEVLDRRVSFRDRGSEWPLNRFTRTLCKYTPFVQTITFHLRRLPLF